MFSKPIQLEFEQKSRELCLKVKVSTFHGAGFGLLASEFGTKYEADKLRRIGKSLNINDYSIFNLVSKAKDLGIYLFPETNSFDFWQEVADRLDLDLGQTDLLKAEKLFQTSIKDVKTCDFSDMQYMPLHYKLVLKKYKVVLLDETQDITAIRLEFLKVCCQHERIIGVGDRHQSIFGFSGSIDDAMSKIASDFNCVDKSLSISWRCSVRVVEECNKIFPGMRARPGAPLGSVRTIDKYQFEEEDFDNDTFILCRINKPLIKIAFWLLERGYNCRIQGRDLGQELINFTKKWKWVSFQELRRKLGRYEMEQQDKLCPKHVKEFNAIVDKINVIRECIDQCEERGRNEPEDLFFVIGELFKDEGEGIVLSTSHRVKGLERKSVFIYGHDLYKRPSWSKKEDWAEEDRISYVAISRAKENVTFINIKGCSEEKKKSYSKPEIDMGKYQKGTGNGMDFQHIESSDEFDF